MEQEDVVKVISKAFERDLVEATRHFWDELSADEFLLADVRCALDAISRVAEVGQDRAGNPRFEVTGPAADGRILSVICSFKKTGAVLLITAYEGSKL